MNICDVCGKNTINPIKRKNITVCYLCHFNFLMGGRCSECGDKGNEVQLEFLNDKLLCQGCYRDIEVAKAHTCSICNGVWEHVSAREQFNDDLMCDLCWDEACSNALNNGPGDTQIDVKAFNEIKKSNNRNR